MTFLKRQMLRFLGLLQATAGTVKEMSKKSKKVSSRRVAFSVLLNRDTCMRIHAYAYMHMNST
jgi:hypothetical protein